MESKFVYRAFMMAIVLLMAGMAVSTTRMTRVDAASVTPIVVDKWKSGNAAFECAEAAGYTGVLCSYSYKFDNSTAGGCTVSTPFDEETMIITISNSNGYTFIPLTRSQTIPLRLLLLRLELARTSSSMAPVVQLAIRGSMHMKIKRFHT